jgi:DNA polymerase-3 subunit gamma/tau
VEDTRDLLENVQYSPAGGRFKVYLIDEVHMLSNHSFNALLKTLEEPPAHVKFLFATTDPQKLPVTILSRCLQFNLKELRLETIANFLKATLEKEEVRFDDEGVWHIAAAAQGSMRDALTLVDQGISHCEGAIESTGIIEMLGVPEKDQIFALLESMAEKRIPRLIEVTNQVSETAPDYSRILENLLSLIHRVTLAQLVPDALDNRLGDKAKISGLADLISQEELQLYYHIGAKGREELGFAIDKKSALEMLLIRMIVFSPEFEAKQAANIEAKAKKKNNGNSIAGNNGLEKRLIDNSVSEGSSSDFSGGDLRSSKGVEAISVGKEQGPSSRDSGFRLNSHEDWLSLYSQVGFAGIIKNIMANTEFVRKEGNKYYFILNEEMSSIFNERMLEKMSAAVGGFLNEVIEIELSVGAVNKETPAKLMGRVKREAYNKMQDEFEKDVNVQELVRHFSGKISKETVSSTTKE